MEPSVHLLSKYLLTTAFSTGLTNQML